MSQRAKMEKEPMSQYEGAIVEAFVYLNGAQRGEEGAAMG